MEDVVGRLRRFAGVRLRRVVGHPPGPDERMRRHSVSAFLRSNSADAVQTHGGSGGANPAQRGAPVQMVRRKLWSVWHLCDSIVWFETSSATDVFPRWGHAEHARRRWPSASVEVAESRGGVPD